MVTRENRCVQNCYYIFGKRGKEEMHWLFPAPGWQVGLWAPPFSPVTMYWESPEKAQSHIQPREVSPGLLLLMLSSVISEKLEVLHILHVWSAEQVAKSLEKGEKAKTAEGRSLTGPAHYSKSEQVWPLFWPYLRNWEASPHLFGRKLVQGGSGHLKTGQIKNWQRR